MNCVVGVKGSVMLALGPDTEPYFKELCEAASQIAALKAQVAKLEKAIDSVLAHHLAGQHLPGHQTTPIAPVAPDVPVVASDDDTANETFDTTARTGSERRANEEGAHCTHPQERDDDASFAAIDNDDTDVEVDRKSSTRYPETQPLRSGSLPSAVRTLICRPAPGVFSEPDDLLLIKGIDCAMALELAARGYSKFEDIANLKHREIGELKASLEGADAIHKESWIEQAAILANGGDTKFARQRLALSSDAYDALWSDTVSGQQRDPKFSDDSDSSHTDDVHVSDDVAAEIPSLDTFQDSDIVLTDEPMLSGFDNNPVDTALAEIAAQEMPRNITISRPMTTVMRSGDIKPFLPVFDGDALDVIQTIQAPVANLQSNDHGNLKAMAASLAATFVVVIAGTTMGIVTLPTSLAHISPTDICQVSGLASFPDACRQVVASVF